MKQGWSPRPASPYQSRSGRKNVLQYREHGRISPKIPDSESPQLHKRGRNPSLLIRPKMKHRFDWDSAKPTLNPRRLMAGFVSSTQLSRRAPPLASPAAPRRTRGGFESDCLKTRWSLLVASHAEPERWARAASVYKCWEECHASKILTWQNN